MTMAMRVRERRAATIGAVLARMADGSEWTTGDLADATGYKYNTETYQALTWLHRHGHAGRWKQRDLYSVYWRWWPSEGTCDTLRLDVDPERCRCWEWGRCWSCTSWARINLGTRREVAP